jgi:hypothetical protein
MDRIDLPGGRTLVGSVASTCRKYVSLRAWAISMGNSELIFAEGNEADMI